MNHRTHRDIAQRQAVAVLDAGIVAGAQHIAFLHALRGDDVATLAVQVLEQRDMRAAVRVVFDTLDDGIDAILVALEVDDAITLLVAATAMTRGDAAGVVATTGLGFLLYQTFVGLALVQARGLDLDDETTPR